LNRSESDNKPYTYSNAMKVTLLGTSGGIPLSGRAQSGVLVESSESKILLDCGMGVPLRLVESGVDAEEIDTICITHGHLDHIQDLASLTKASWLDIGKADYQVVVPPGLERKLVDMWRCLEEYDRTDLKFTVLEPGEVIDGELDIRPFKTDHTESSQGYNISDGDREIAYTGDTAPRKEVIDKVAKTDLLIHELSLIEESEAHTDPEGLMANIEGTDIKKLVLTHFYPPVAERIEELASKIEEKIGIDTEPGEDLQEYRI